MVTQAENDQTHVERCDFCGVDVKRFGTSTNLEVFYEDYKYAGYPAFCSWQHAAGWFAGPRPDFEMQDKGFTRDDEGFQYGGLIFVFFILALSVYGLVSLIRAIL